MRLISLATVITGFAAAAPVVNPVVARGFPLVGALLGKPSVTTKTTSGAVVTSSSVVSSYPSSMPSSFPDPVQGSGALTLKNLPALPPVLDKTVSGAIGIVYGLRKST
jgi:hypothetical protein